MKTWIESERQGRGRRYWFDSIIKAEDFAYERVRKGKLVEIEMPSRTVWVSNANVKNVDNVTRYRYDAGIDQSA